MHQSRVDGGLIEEAHRAVADVVRLGDVVVDATLGNGHDTLFLARCVGNSGQVFGFDVQQQAIRSTGKRLAEADIAESVCQLYLESHAKMGEHVPEGVRAVMFNLGYLPGGDKAMITRVDTSLAAVTAALSLLAAGGVLTAMCYPGHEGGSQEALAVKNLLAGISRECFDVELIERDGASASAPFLLVAKKRPAPGGELAAND